MSPTSGMSRLGPEVSATILPMPLRNPAVFWLTRSLVGGVAFALLVSPLGAGFFTSRLNFTYGTRGLDRSVWGEAGLEVVLWIGAGILFEAVFRRGLLERLRTRVPSLAAIALHLLVLNLLIAPAVYLRGIRTDVLSCGAVLVYENLLQVLFTVAYLRFGSFLLSGSLHGAFAALRFTLINDVSGSFETLFFYSYSNASFGWVLTLSPVLASSWFWIASRALRLTVGPRRPATGN